MLRAFTGVLAAIFRSIGRRSGTHRQPSSYPSHVVVQRCRGVPSDNLLPNGSQCGCGGSRNYLVTQTAPNKFRCEVMIQDGWERWDEPSLESAKVSVISAAEVLNGVVLGESCISIAIMTDK